MRAQPHVSLTHILLGVSTYLLVGQLPWAQEVADSSPVAPPEQILLISRIRRYFVSLPGFCISTANEALAILTGDRSEEHTSELQSPCNLVCRLLLEKKKKK